MHNHDGRRVYARVDVYRDDSGNYRARLAGNQSSGALHSMARGHEDWRYVLTKSHRFPQGQEIEVEMMDWPDDDLLVRASKN